MGRRKPKHRGGIGGDWFRLQLRPLAETVGREVDSPRLHQKRSITNLTKVDYIFSIAMAVIMIGFATTLVLMGV